MLIAYLDCFSGVSGDMLLGALVGAGLPLDFLQERLKQFGLQGFTLEAKEVLRKGFKCTKVEVLIGEDHKNRYQFQEILQLMETKLSLDDRTKVLAREIFSHLAQAEAAVHGREIDHVHFHELGDLDSLVDVLGAIIGFHYFGLGKIYSSPLNLGNGFVNTEHGKIPVPAPVVLELLKGHPVYCTNSLSELTTPTGAAILATMASEFIPMPPMKLEKIGLGAGHRDSTKLPNLVRLIIGQSQLQEADQEEVMVLEANIDDMNPEILPHLLDKLLDSGALDAFITPIIMKKGRPAYKLSALAPTGKVELLAEIILQESSTFGLRMYQTRRFVLDREIVEIKTTYGQIKIKIGRWKGHIVQATPEFEDCRKLAGELGIPLKLIYQEAQKEGLKFMPSKYSANP